MITSTRNNLYTGAFLAALDGSCRTPIAGLARKDAAGRLTFRGLVASPDGKKIYATSREGAANELDAVAMGREAGEQIKKDAGPEFFNW